MHFPIDELHDDRAPHANHPVSALGARPGAHKCSHDKPPKTPVSALGAAQNRYSPREAASLDAVKATP